MRNKLYVIEVEVVWYDKPKYRYRSLYNGAVGSWNNDKNEAEMDGLKHQEIIYDLFGKK